MTDDRNKIDEQDEGKGADDRAEAHMPLRRSETEETPEAEAHLYKRDKTEDTPEAEAHAVKIKAAEEGLEREA